jgi:hypothetical protein
VERNVVKGNAYLSYRLGKGPRIRLPSNPDSDEFRRAYAAAINSEIEVRPKPTTDVPKALGALIASYLRSDAFLVLGKNSKSGYMGRLDILRRADLGEMGPKTRKATLPGRQRRYRKNRWLRGLATPDSCD